MSTSCYSYASSSTFSVPSAVKCITYIAVAGGGGGARPNNGDPYFGQTPTSGGATYGGPSGLYAGGGGPGQWYYGGYGGYGNYSYGQTGFYNSSGGNTARARSGYGPYGQGGAGQWRSPTQSYGGGGGGASICTVGRNTSGAIPGQYISFTVGYGGVQGGTGNCRYAFGGAYYITVCNYDRPSASVSASPSAIIRGQNTTVSWSTSGDTDSEILNSSIDGSFGQVSRSGSITVNPQQTTTYTYTVSNPAYTVSETTTVTVYIPPVVNLTTNAANNTIIQGNSTTLFWSVTGDASSMTITPGIGTAVLNGSQQVSPSVTTTYTATASGLGGTGSAEVTVTVLPPPTIQVAGPISIYYNESPIPVSIDATNVEGGISYVVTKFYGELGNAQGLQTVTSPAVTIPNSIGDSVNIFYDIPIEYDTFGPRRISINFTADGYGSLTATDSLLVNVNIDETPDYIDIPETEDTIRNEEPVVTPDTEVTSEQIVINDIDIPVEIKSDYPIQVEIDNSDTWLNVREL